MRRKYRKFKLSRFIDTLIFPREKRTASAAAMRLIEATSRENANARRTHAKRQRNRLIFHGLSIRIIRPIASGTPARDPMRTQNSRINARPCYRNAIEDERILHRRRP